MPDLIAWYIPGQPSGFLVLRGSTGLWAFPTRQEGRNAWNRQLRFRVSREPDTDPMPPTLARQVANLLGVPGYGPLSTDEEALAGWEQIEEQVALREPDSDFYHQFESEETQRKRLRRAERVGVARC